MNWEITILQYLQSIRNTGLTALMETLSFIAESVFLVLIIATLYWCVDKKQTVRWGWMILFSALTNGILKNMIKAPRPFQQGVVSPLRVETATSYSFPSGHTQNATSFWGGATKIFKTKSVGIISVVAILLVGLSRMYLGVHWPIDIMGGIAVGLLSILVADLLYDETKGFSKNHVIGVGMIAVLLVFLPIERNLLSAAGGLWGFVMGVFLEQNYIHFETKGDWRTQLKKLVIGFGGTIIIYLVLANTVEISITFKLFNFACILLWITAGAPYVFKKFLEKKKQ